MVTARKDIWILGIAGSHNGAAALIRNGQVVVAVQTERLVRRKRCPIRLENLMTAEAGQTIAYCLRHAGIDFRDLAGIATCTPWRAVTPQFVDHDGEVVAPSTLPPFSTVPHHLAHAEYALHYGPGSDCLVLVADGSGTYEDDRRGLDLQEQEDAAQKFLEDDRKEAISAYTYRNGALKLIYRQAYGDAFRHGGRPSSSSSRWLASVGQVWRWAAHYCHGNSGDAGKVMGLSAFGDPAVHRHLQTLRLEPSGRVVIDIPTLSEMFTTPNHARRDVTGEAHYADIAAHIQEATTAFLDEFVRFLLARTNDTDICYTGGVALNGVANAHLADNSGARFHLNGSCEDNGTAIGAALALHHKLTGSRAFATPSDYHGRPYSSAEIASALAQHKGKTTTLPRAELNRRVAAALAEGKVVGWFQGRSEFGPRALGNRSILADPRRTEMQDTLNARVKFREAFRPYAPIVKEDRASEFFDLDEPSPMMLRVVPARDSQLPAITHVDGTARVQTVNRRQNPQAYDLLSAFEAQTGVPVLLNTSFNLAGEPIIESPADALDTFTRTAIDLLVLGDALVERPVETALAVKAEVTDHVGS